MADYEQELEQTIEKLERHIAKLEEQFSNEIEQTPVVFRWMMSSRSFENISISDHLVRDMTCEQLKTIAHKLGFKFVRVVEHSSKVKAKTYEVWMQESQCRFSMKSDPKTGRMKINRRSPIDIQVELPHSSNSKQAIQKSLRALVNCYSKVTGYDEMYSLFHITKLWLEVSDTLK